MARRSRQSTQPLPVAGAGRAEPTAGAPSAPWWLVALGLAAVAVFANSLSGQFVHDDDEAILGNPFIRALWPLSSALSSPPQSAVSGRPLVSLSLAVNHAVGGLDPTGYHVWNIAVHAGVALLLFGVIRRTLRTARVPAALQAAADTLAGVCAFVWLVHPLNSEVVDATVLRTESMMAFCYLLTLYAAIRGWLGQRRRGAWLTASVAACLLGAACKESIVTAPLMVWLYDAVFVAGGLSAALRRRPWYYGGLLLSWGLLIVLNASGPRFRSAGFTTGIPWWTYLLHQGPMIATYLRLAVWPHPLIADYGRTMAIPPAAALPAVLLVAGLVALVAAQWRRRPMLAFLGTWCLVTLAPSSSVVPIATEVGAERRMYLPLMALVVLGVLAVRQVVWRLTPLRRRAVAGGMAGAIAVALGATTIARNRDFHDRLALWESVVAHRPHGRAHYNLAVELKARGRGDEALSHYAQAAAEAPEAHYALGFELAERGRVDEAIGHLRQFIDREPDDRLVPRAHTLLGLLLGQRGDAAAAIAAFEATLRMRPGDVEARGGLADALRAAGRLDDAERAYRAYLEVQPANAAAYGNLGAVLAALGRIEAAVAAFARGVELAPTAADGRLNLGLALMALGKTDEAMAEFRRGLALDAGHVPLTTALAEALASTGARAEAIVLFRRALDLSPGNPDATAGLAMFGAGAGGRLESPRR